MVIERTDDEIIVRLAANLDVEELQDAVDYLAYKEATANSKARQSDVDQLAEEVKKGWWLKNRDRLLK